MYHVIWIHMVPQIQWFLFLSSLFHDFIDFPHIFVAMWRYPYLIALARAPQTLLGDGAARPRKNARSLATATQRCWSLDHWWHQWGWVLLVPPLHPKCLKPDGPCSPWPRMWAAFTGFKLNTNTWIAWGKSLGASDLKHFETLWQQSHSKITSETCSTLPVAGKQPQADCHHLLP